MTREPSTDHYPQPTRRVVLLGAGAGLGATAIGLAVAGPATAASLRDARWCNPTLGRRTSAYGSRDGGWHAGWDIANTSGTAIYAAAAGTVVRRGWNVVSGRTGNGLVLSHGSGRYTYYGHLSAFRVALGAAVGAGQRIADMGTTGNSTGPHLHFEVQLGSIGADTNPLTYLSNRGVVLGGGWSAIDPGANGATVTVIQRLMNRRGYGLAVDGVYGSVSVTAVKRFQTSKGLVADGQVGAKTWPHLIYTLRQGASGDHVRALQTALNKRSAGLVVDGGFGAVTHNAVRAYQTANRLYADGEAGPVTWRALVG